MRIELKGYGEGALLDLCTILTMNRSVHGDRLGVFGNAVNVVLDGLHTELIRRWQKQGESPIAIELPQFNNSEQAEVGRMFMILGELLRGRFSSSDPLPAPFLADSLRLAQSLALAACPITELRN